MTTPKLKDANEPIYSFELSRKIYEAICLFQSKDESRVILNAAQHEIVVNGLRAVLTLIATDGRRIGVHQSEIISDNLLTDLPKEAKFAFDLKGVKKLPKLKGAAGDLLTVSVFANHAEVTLGKHKYKGEFIEGSFPNWRQCIPAQNKVAREAFTFNYSLMLSFAQAAKFLTDKSEAILIESYGDEGSVMGVKLPEYPSFFGLIMPIKSSEDKDTQLDWVDALAAQKNETNTKGDAS